MTSTGTYSFDPPGGDLVLNAFAKCQIFRPQITPEHIENAIFEANLLNVDMTNRNPNQFALETITQTLAAETATYTLNARIASVALAYVTNDSNDNSRPIARLSAAQYARVADKTQTDGNGPSSYFVSFLKTPTLTVWPLVPTSSTVTYTVNMLVFRQNQDFEAKNGTTTDLPYRFLDAFVLGLAHRLALIYRPDRAVLYGELYEAAFTRAAALDQEDVPITIIPNFGAYR